VCRHREWWRCLLSYPVDILQLRILVLFQDFIFKSKFLSGRIYLNCRCNELENFRDKDASILFCPLFTAGDTIRTLSLMSHWCLQICVPRLPPEDMTPDPRWCDAQRQQIEVLREVASHWLLETRRQPMAERHAGWLGPMS